MQWTDVQTKIMSPECPYVLRVVDGSIPGDEQAGSAVLVGLDDKYGYALTCWHNIDGDFSRAAAWTVGQTGSSS